MMEKTDINGHEGEEFFSNYPIDTYRHFMIKSFIIFSYCNICSFTSTMTTTH